MLNNRKLWAGVAKRKGEEHWEEWSKLKHPFNKREKAMDILDRFVFDIKHLSESELDNKYKHCLLKETDLFSIHIGRIITELRLTLKDLRVRKVI